MSSLGLSALGLAVLCIACGPKPTPPPPGMTLAAKAAALAGGPGPAGGEVIFAHRSSGDLSMTVTKPKGNSNHIGVILIHGGGWVGSNRAEMFDIANAMVLKGFTTFCIDYRLAPKDLWPAQLLDVQEAVKYVRIHAKEYDINGTKLGAAGISAGGHLSLLLGTQGTRDERVQAVGSISGIHDLNAPLTPEGETYHIVQKVLGEKGAPNKDARAKASPITYIDKHSAPTYFIQGDADPLVPSMQTTDAMKALRRVGVPADAVMVPKMGHGLVVTEPLQKAALDRLCDWLVKYLK